MYFYNVKVLYYNGQVLCYNLKVLFYNINLSRKYSLFKLSYILSYPHITINIYSILLYSPIFSSIHLYSPLFSYIPTYFPLNPIFSPTPYIPYILPCYRYITTTFDLLTVSQSLFHSTIVTSYAIVNCFPSKYLYCSRYYWKLFSWLMGVANAPRAVLWSMVFGH